MLRILLLGSMIASAVALLSGQHIEAASPAEMIRVAIVKNAATVTISGEGLLAVRENGTAVPLNPPVIIKPAKDVVVVDGVPYRRLIITAASEVVVNGRPYRGVADVSVADAGVLVVNEVPLEEYLVGLINCEISSAWPIEAVKAQAVIARTYALNRKEARRGAPYHLESSIMDQVYNGSRIEDSRARRGVSETAGEVLTYQGDLVQAFYHSNCGGRTEAAENVWGTAIPYLKGVDCQYCLSAPSGAWQQTLSLKDIEERLRAAGFKVGTVTDVKGGVRNNRGRLKNVIVSSSRGDVAVPGDQFRKALGYGIIKSTNFTVATRNGEASFSGIGNGHGVGLCQWGAKQRALEGFTYAEILSYYYPGTTLTKLPGRW